MTPHSTEGEAALTAARAERSRKLAAERYERERRAKVRRIAGPDLAAVDAMNARIAAGYTPERYAELMTRAAREWRLL